MAIFAVMLLGVYGVLGTGNAVISNDNALLDMQQQARNGLIRMVKELRQASTVTISGASNNIVTFTIPTASNIKYYLSTINGVSYLVREYPAGTVKNISNNIAYLNFSLNSRLLTMKLRADKLIYSKTVSFSLAENVRLRN